jgi:hypothetical protein
VAYFSNATEGEVFDCSDCQLYIHDGEFIPCPIAMLQMTYNYKQVGNEVATEMLSELVRDDGTCTMEELLRRITLRVVANGRN